MKKDIDQRIITFDLESTTIKSDDNKSVVPYLISLYNGKESLSTYLSHKIDGSESQNKAIEDMFNIAMRDLINMVGWDKQLIIMFMHIIFLASSLRKGEEYFYYSTFLLLVLLSLYSIMEN